MWQQVIKVGNSAAVTIPKDFLREAKIKIGDKVLVEPDPTAKILTIKSKVKTVLLSEEFGNWSDKFVNKYLPLLKELAKK